jgi:hypothetical protein
MLRSSRVVALVLGSAVALSACSANHNSIYRYRELTDNRDSVVLVDAKQRAILQQVFGSDAPSGLQVRRFCSEPSPDVFSVIAQALSAGGTFGQSADPKSIEAALNLAYSSAETGSTIPRTQTINMLRELMFRTCERYLSGGYDEMELSIQAVRDQRLMVSILAIEQLTGAVTPNPVVLSAGGSGTAGLGGAAIETFAALRTEKTKADKAAAEAKATYDEKFGTSDKTDRECTAARKAEEPNAELLETCMKIEDKKNATAAAAKDAGEAYDTVREAMATGGVSTTTVTDAIANGGLSRVDADSVEDVARTVEAIVRMNFNDNTETMLFCLRSLRTTAQLDMDEGSKKLLVDQCLAFLEAELENETEKARLETEQYRQDLKRSQDARQETRSSIFDVFWAAVASDVDKNKVDRIKLSQRLKKTSSRADGRLTTSEQKFRTCFDNKVTKEAIRECFEQGSTTLQYRLVE